MIKVLAAALFAIATPTMLAAAPTAAGHRAPHDMVTRTDDGYLMGRPDAPRKLTIVSSFGCIHCAHLEQEGMAKLRSDWVDTGKVQLRFVPFMMFPTDVPTLILGDCGPAATFFRRSSAIFARRDVTENSFRQQDPAKLKRLQTAGVREQTLGIYDAAALPGALPSLGIRPADAQACLTNEALRAKLKSRQALVEQRYHPRGTPTVILDGQQIGGSWTAVEAALKQTR